MKLFSEHSSLLNVLEIKRSEFKSLMGAAMRTEVIQIFQFALM